MGCGEGHPAGEVEQHKGGDEDELVAAQHGGKTQVRSDSENGLLERDISAFSAKAIRSPASMPACNPKAEAGTHAWLTTSTNAQTAIAAAEASKTPRCSAL